MKIIMVDDEKEFTDLMKTLLTARGFQVIVDPNGNLLDHLQTDFPDLIMLDINLKNRDGGDLCSRLKEDSRTRKIPVILISAIMDLRQISQFCGADDYLIKPFEKAALLDKLEFYRTRTQLKSI